MTDVQDDQRLMGEKRKQKGRSRRGLIIGAAWLAVGISVTAGSAAWLGYKASVISSELKTVRQLMPELKEQIVRDDITEASVTVDQLLQHTSAARLAANDPLWTIAGELPALGANFKAVQAVATATDDVARLGGDPLVDVARSINWQTLTPNASGVDLKPLMLAQPTLASAAHAVRQSSDRLNEIDTTALVHQVSDPLRQAREQLSSLRGGLDAAADAAAVAPAMMGADIPRQYLLLIQNNAEARATGGIPGALAVLQVDNGKLTLRGQSSAIELGAMAPIIPVAPEQQQIFSGRLGEYMQDVNLTPDFPTSASTAVAMWERKTGDRLDGVLSVDPVALSYLMEATGPIQLSDPRLRDLANGVLPRELTAKNVVKTLLSDVYAALPEPALQDLYFAGVAQETFTALSSGKSDADKLLAGVSRGVAENRIMVWSADPNEQGVIANYVLSGSINGSSIAPAQFGVYFNDGTGAKMDYYVKRTVQLVEECTGNGYGQIKVRITSTNTAPADAATSLPAYVTGGGVFGVPPGTVQTNVIAYGPVQANVETAHVDGKKVSFAANRHANRPVGTVTVTLAPGQSSTVELTFGKIVQHTKPNLVVTPNVQAVNEVVLATETAECVPRK
jgi:hypothetical protein